jgi:ankyrin repeat protein
LTPLDHASMNGHLGVARLLLAHGAHFKFPGSKSPTPHRYALKNGHREVARLLAHAATTHTLDDGTPLPQASRVGVARVLGEHSTGPRGWIRRISSPVRFSTRREEA